jgi:hypothetical protein
METNYRPTGAPVGSKGIAHDCAECGHPELKNVVWLTDGSAARPYGTGCAALKLGWARTRTDGPTKAAFDRRYYRALQDEAHRLLRAERDARLAGDHELSETLTAEVKAVWAALSA